MDEYDDQWIEDILYYEGPLLALFRDNGSGHYSFHYWLGVVEEKYNKWVVFNITEDLLKDYKLGKQSLYQIATNTMFYRVGLDGGDALRVYLLDEDLNTVRNELVPITDDLLPPVDSYYDPDLAPQHYYTDFQ